MSTLFYQWGVGVGGIDPATGIPPPVVVSVTGGSSGGGGGVSGPPEQFAGTLGAGVTTISFANTTLSTTIRNTDDQNALEYSYDNATWFYCGPYQVVQECAQVSQLYLRAVAGTPTYEVLAILEP